VAGFDEASTLFVYGNLLDERLQRELLGRTVSTVPATLHDYARERARFFYVTPRPGALTPGLLLLDLRSHDFATLDRYEEVPVLYLREKIDVSAARGAIQRCWIYLPTPLTMRGG